MTARLAAFGARRRQRDSHKMALAERSRPQFRNVRFRPASGYFVTETGKTVWVVETKDALRPIGLIFISKHRDEGDSELSYQFSPQAWGMGYAIEATRRVLDYAAENLSLDRLVAETQ